MQGCRVGGRWHARRAFLALAAGWAAGCGAAGSEDYVPASGTAREAVEAALTAWVEGSSTGALETTPAVHAVDSRWQSGARLVQYEVLNEEESAEGRPRQFRVRLVLEGAAEPEEVTYFVLGREPYWVFRDTDFARLEGWEHHAPRNP